MKLIRKTFGYFDNFDGTWVNTLSTGKRIKNIGTSNSHGDLKIPSKVRSRIINDEIKLNELIDGSSPRRDYKRKIDKKWDTALHREREGLKSSRPNKAYNTKFLVGTARTAYDKEKLTKRTLIARNNTAAEDLYELQKSYKRGLKYKYAPDSASIPTNILTPKKLPTDRVKELKTLAESRRAASLPAIVSSSSDNLSAVKTTPRIDAPQPKIKIPKIDKSKAVAAEIIEEVVDGKTIKPSLVSKLKNTWKSGKNGKAKIIGGALATGAVIAGGAKLVSNKKKKEGLNSSKN